MNSYSAGSHVMEYGDKTFKDEKLYLYQGFNPANTNITNKLFLQAPKAAINQRDADLLFLWRRVCFSVMKSFSWFANLFNTNCSNRLLFQKDDLPQLSSLLSIDLSFLLHFPLCKRLNQHEKLRLIRYLCVILVLIWNHLKYLGQVCSILMSGDVISHYFVFLRSIDDLLSTLDISVAISCLQEILHFSCTYQ